jgi:sigma-B regulation protein RsbU (phosphoserine phosphatase)
MPSIPANPLTHERFALTSLLDFARTLTPDLGSVGILKSVIRTVMGKALIKDALAFVKHEGRFHLVHRAGFVGIEISDDQSEVEIELWAVRHDDAIAVMLNLSPREIEGEKCLLIFGDSMIPGMEIEEETDFLESISRLASMAISNARMFEREQERERIEADLRLAREIQLSLFPQSLPTIEHLELAAYSKPCEVVGGDYYDVIKLSEHEVLIAIADVVGKGVAASLLMSNVQASLRALVSIIRNGQLGLLDVVEELNRLLFESTSAERFVTAAFVIIDTKRARILSVVAGHPYPIILHANGKTSSLESSGIPLGIIPTFSYEFYERAFKPGDALLLYTDGLSESRIAEKELGPSGIANILSSLNDANAGSIIDVLARNSDNSDMKDDLTLIAASFKK